VARFLGRVDCDCVLAGRRGDSVDDGRSEDAADLGKIQLASKHLLGLINGILDLSKIEAGKMDLHLETFDVRAMTDDYPGTVDSGAAARHAYLWERD